LVILVAGPTEAGRSKHEFRKIDAEGANRIEVQLEFVVGELRVLPDDVAEAAVLDLTYDPRRVEYDIDYKVRRGTGYLAIESSRRRKNETDTEDNKLDLLLSTRYPVSLEMDIGACDAEIDLGGVRLERLDIDIGAASGDIDFSEPNPQRLEEIDIDAGASSLDLHSIGNANFDLLTFDGGVGSFDLDFRGRYEGESRIEIDIGLGSADIILPRGVPVRVESSGSGWFSSVDFHNEDLDEMDDNAFESSDFDTAKTRIIIDIDVGMGSADIYWKR
jgi:hypothetical protein